MIFLKLILLFLIFKLDRLEATKTASLIIDDSPEVKIENILTEFMTDLKKFGFENLNDQRFIILGKREDFLQATKVLLESGMPYFISTKAEATVLPLHFGTHSIVLFFIDGSSESEMSSAFAKLPKNFLYKVLLISLEENRTDASIARIIASAAKMKLTNLLFAGFNGQEVKIYNPLLNADCKRELTLLNTWTPGNGFGKNEHVFRYNVIVNHQGCPLVTSTFEASPTMKLREDENKSLQITGGAEGLLAKTIAQYLNMEIVVKVPSVKERLVTTPNGTVLGIVGDVARRAADLGIGQIVPTQRRAEMVDLTTHYNQECLVWTVPLRTKYNYSVVVSEFSPTIWIVVILSVALFSGLVYAIPKLNLGYNRRSLTILDVIAMTLNYAIPRNPSGLLCKLLFLLYLNYSRIISTAYSTSLSSILATTTPEPTIVDEEGILAAGLRTAGTESGLNLLVNQIPANSTRSELIDRYEVITSVDAALARIADRQDIAYLCHHSTIIHAAKKLSMAGKPVKFHPIPKCVVSFNSVMVTRKGSRLTRQVNHITLRLVEAGIFNQWLTLDHKSKIPESHPHLTFGLESVFVLYFCCMIPATLAFVAELIVFKLRPNWFPR